ncbi:MAG: hypothetical protein KGL39_40330 [Patescibacteria group bacterium]|nr:hypothetical protein [Patescibacteria group bacterium]
MTMTCWPCTLVIGFVILGIGVSGWCIRSHADDCVRDPGKREVKPGTLKVLD